MKHDEFEKKMIQLLELIKGIMKHSSNGRSPFTNLFENNPGDKTNINICFFNFIPVTPEEMEDLEDLCGDMVESGHDDEADDFSPDFGWTKNDVEFLKRHGMSF